MYTYFLLQQEIRLFTFIICEISMLKELSTCAMFLQMFDKVISTKEISNHSFCDMISRMIKSSSWVEYS